MASTKTSETKRRPMVIVDLCSGRFLQGKRFVTEYPDADEFLSLRDARKALDKADRERCPECSRPGNLRIVNGYGQADESDAVTGEEIRQLASRPPAEVL